MQEQKIVNITEIMLGFELALGELVQLVKIDIGEKLGSEIADGQALIFRNMKKGFVGRDFGKKGFIALAGEVFGRIVENDDFGQP